MFARKPWRRAVVSAHQQNLWKCWRRSRRFGMGTGIENRGHVLFVVHAPVLVSRMQPLMNYVSRVVIDKTTMREMIEHKTRFRHLLTQIIGSWVHGDRYILKAAPDSTFVSLSTCNRLPALGRIAHIMSTNFRLDTRSSSGQTKNRNRQATSNNVV